MRGATRRERCWCGFASSFQSTHPMRGATTETGSRRRWNIGFQSTHPMRGATFRLGSFFSLIVISIHAPHAGCDDTIYGRRAPPYKFQSTHPMRGATALYPLVGPFTRYFNPRTPCGVRLRELCHFKFVILISIHAPHAGCDDMERMVSGRKSSISIHAPHAGCDPGRTVHDLHPVAFQSTHPMRGATIWALAVA